MPLKWQRGINPYFHNFFGRLKLGANATPPQIVEQTKSMRQKLANGKLTLGELDLDEHAIGEASRMLREPKHLAEELLLVHPQAANQVNSWKKLIEKLQQTAKLDTDHHILPLIYPWGILWFIPTPGSEVAKLPELDELGLVGPGDKEDRTLDIVFDC